jgi:hypothetical protein
MNSIFEDFSALFGIEQILGQLVQISYLFDITINNNLATQALENELC